MLFLHDAPGKYQVGATTFISPADVPRVIGNAKVQSGNDLKPLLKLEEVAFTVFYPARTEGTNYGVDWIPRPLKHFVRGSAKFSNVSTWIMWLAVALVGQFIKIPVHRNAPPLDPNQEGDSNNSNKARKQWPLVIFSHGLCGSRTTYSQICSRMAASGKVVISMEHRDATGPAVVDSKGNATLYARPEEVVWEDSVKPTDSWKPLRADQLVYRRHEVYRAYSAFRQLVQGRSNDMDNTFKLLMIDGGKIDSENWLNAVNCDERVGLVGHSFGGATLFSILSNPPPDETYPTLPLTHAVAFDPWLEPFPSPGPVPYNPPPPTSQNPQASSATADNISAELGLSIQLADTSTSKTSRPQLLVINGEGFTLWEEHFQRLETLMRTWEPDGRRLLTIVHAFHSYFSDVHLLPLWRRHEPTAKPIMDVVSKLTVAFIEGRGEDGLNEVKTRKFEVEEYRKAGKTKTRLVGDVADVVVH